MLEVSLSRHTCAARVVLKDEHRDALVFWYYDGMKRTTSGEDHVVAFFPNTDKSFTLEYAHQNSVGNLTKSGGGWGEVPGPSPSRRREQA
jgi:hypothetical protein